MILSMRMHNLALIESLTMDFSTGLHVMTGETGAGKSIVVDAVNLVLGGRADRDLIRTGTDKAWVEATFDAAGNAHVAALLESQQLENEGGIVTLYREITRSGRNLCRVCGVVLPLAYLREMAALLMDVHGQHEHQFLMDPKRHLQFLDASGDDEHQQLMHQVSEAWSAFMKNHRAYARLLRENQRKTERMKIEDLVALTKAGYTKADIEALGIALGQGSAIDAKPEESKPKEEKPAEESKPKEEKPAEAVKPESDRLKEMETKLDYAINRLNYMSVQGSSQPEQKKESIEDILQSVLK